MSHFIKSLYAATTAAAILISAAPVMAQTVNNLNVIQPPGIAQAEPEPALEQAPPIAAEASRPPAPQKQKTQHSSPRKKQHKKKTNHKSGTKAHKKTAKKKNVTHKKHEAKKKTVAPAPAPHARNTHRASVAPKVAAKTVKKPLAGAGIASVPVAKGAPAPFGRAPNTGVPGKSVTYNFCLGYDNCVPHRYESSGRAARVMRRDANGIWAEARLDPTIMADLGKMAQAEPGSRVERDLTPREKAVIADHQGKVHATLVSDVEAGPEKKEDVKNLMRELHIATIDDLDAYDPRLRKHDVAVQAVNEISVER